MTMTAIMTVIHKAVDLAATMTTRNTSHNPTEARP